jgi:hypothetical protein
MHFVRLLASISLFFAPAVALAAQPTEGRWALRTGGRPILILELHKDPAAKGGWAGGLTRPKHLEAGSNFTVFSKVEGPAAGEIVVDAAAQSDRLVLTVKDSASELTHLLWTPSDSGGSLKFTDFHFSVDLAPAAADERVPDVWDKDRTYTAVPDWPDNAEMARIYAADQAARENPSATDWSAIGKEDAARKARTKALLDAGQLRSGTDFYYAAFVFQHGATPGDYLMAHTLAVIAAARGRSDATWIASATLDRYLQGIGQKQIFGTQFRTPEGQPATQDPYDRFLVSDVLREALGVPTLAAQEEQRKAFNPAKP